MQHKVYDVAVLGAGAAGVPAAIAAAESGLRTVVVDRSPLPGGELISGLPALGCANASGQVTTPGVLSRLLDRLGQVDAYVGLKFDWRTMWGACFDAEMMKLVVADLLHEVGVTCRVSTQAVDVLLGNDNRIEGIVVNDGRESDMISAKYFVDASGDGWLAERAGVEMLSPSADEGQQPVSLTFRMCNVDYATFLEYAGMNPDDLIVAENPVIGLSEAAAATRVAESGVPFVAVGSHKPGNRLATAIEDGRMFPTTAFYMWPTSLARREVGLNVTRTSGVDGSNMESVSSAIPELTAQVRQASTYLTGDVPGFKDASISAIAARVGVRETKRIVGVEVLETADVISGRKRPDGIARGSHHVDIHGRGTFQLRKYIEGGASYDVPYGSLLAQGVPNLAVAGRCISSSREANSSVRVMGSCIATGEAAGTAIGVASELSIDRLKDVPVESVRERLHERGALVDASVT